MRLIDADAFKAKLAEEEITFPMLDFAPTVDAVPVIRCKECKYAYRGYKKYVCTRQFNDFSIWPDGYCSLAERKDNETD